MSFSIPPGDDKGSLTYADYLRVHELTSLQHPRIEPAPHDETLFIIIHQVYELWFKQLLHEIGAIIRQLDEDQTLGAYRLLGRCVEIERVLINQVSILETMSPMDFLAFRDNLRPASGFQSAQFRELEILSGLRDHRYVKNYDPGTEEHARLEARLEQPSLLDAFYDMLRRRGFNMPADPDDSEGRDAASRQRIRELMRIYEESNRHYDLLLLAESLIEYDEMFSLWRIRHVQMAERVIGGKTGTGGSEGAAYLKRTIERKFFPELWEVRNYLGTSGSY